MVTRIWIDVEDLFEYGRHNLRPSGIQRLAFEIYLTLQEQHGATGRVFFVRHDSLRNSFRVVHWSKVAAIFAELTECPASVLQPSFGPPSVITPHSPARQLVRKLIYRLPSRLRVRLVELLLAHARALRAWGSLLTELLRAVADISAALRRQHTIAKVRTVGFNGPAQIAAGETFVDLVSPNDILLVLGAPWSHPDYATLARKQCKQHGLRFALLIYDLIVLRRPEWFDRGLVRLFREWFTSLIPLCDVVFAISKATATDIKAYALERGIVLSSHVATIPIGTGFRAAISAERAPCSSRMPLGGEYVLIVSTIEARKNHLLLFRIWRRMLEELPREQVPTLVFAGRIGWLVDDLMQQIANTASLEGKLVIIESPGDAELAELYQGCLFTLFPSFYEGWGLPITESLAFGKPCITSNQASLLEAGSGFTRTFDPDNLHDAYAVILDVLNNRVDLARWEAEIRSNFRPVPWAATVDGLMAGLGYPLAAASEHKGHKSLEICGDSQRN